ncbi:fusaric acid resistance protein [Acinetobacter larvae]|uniref:Fusaric acid resistance protein n=1 Tax=Acinetobacter larvae TaxID=1789224 RepID=A0A1B2LWA8_9GAMM|nr:fusaric acid resistance protein [Acinetobacter larvae]
MALIFAAKTFLAGMLALFASFELDLINPMWSIGTVLIIASPYSGMVSSKCVYRLIGTLAGAIVAIVLTPHFINTPWLFNIILSLWVGFALYVSLLDRTPRSYVFMLAGYSTAMIVYNAVTFIDQYSIFDLALARVLEISIGVIASAVVSATIFPVHIGSAIRLRVTKALGDIERLFANVLQDSAALAQHAKEKPAQILAQITRDTTEIHALAVHLSYEKGDLKGMTKPLQEMLHQISMVVANLVAMFERVQQLQQGDSQPYATALTQICQQVLSFLKAPALLHNDDILALPENYNEQFQQLIATAPAEDQVLLAAIQMDVRHFMSNVLAVKVIWQHIQAGDKNIPTQITPLTTHYPSLHRDHGVAIRGGISAVMTTFIVTAIWILSGWKTGYMMAQMGAITACILTALDNPVPVLKIFLWGSIVSGILVFIYAFGVFPHITAFWQLALVLLPLVLISVSMMTDQMLMPIGMVLGINTMMGLNLHNSYRMDAVTYLDTTMAMLVGVMVSLIVIDLVRAMSPDQSARRILALHYRALRQALGLSYGADFKVHLRSMLDRVGVLNSKMVQQPAVQQAIRHALYECSALVDFTRLDELTHARQSSARMRELMRQLKQQLQQLFTQQAQQLHASDHMQQQLQQQLTALALEVAGIEDLSVQQRWQISLNNIAYSLCHFDQDFMAMTREAMQSAMLTRTEVLEKATALPQATENKDQANG